MAEGQGQFSFWSAGSRRKIRVFVSHRWDEDETLYNQVLGHVVTQGFGVQDLSLSKEQRRTGPRGGDLEDLEIQREIAARIYTSDLLIAPSRPATSRAEWLTWEVELAAVAYAIPVLFVDHRPDLQRRTYLIRAMEAAGAKFELCDATVGEIAYHVARLARDPFWGVRTKEEDIRVQYRGPIPAACADVLRRFPYEEHRRS